MLRKKAWPNRSPDFGEIKNFQGRAAIRTAKRRPELRWICLVICKAKRNLPIFGGNCSRHRLIDTDLYRCPAFDRHFPRGVFAGASPQCYEDDPLAVKRKQRSMLIDPE